MPSKTQSAEATAQAALHAAYPSLGPFKLTPPAFLARHYPSPAVASGFWHSVPTLLATGAIVFDRPMRRSGAAAPFAAPRVLLVQRDADGSMPLRWETPGGGCYDNDVSVLRACAYELQLVTGLAAVAVGPLVRCPGSEGSVVDGPAAEEPARGDHMGGHIFRAGKDELVFRERKDKLVCKFYFVAEPPTARLAEVGLHADYVRFVWASEDEVCSRRTAGDDGVDLTFTTLEQWAVLLEAFKVWRAGHG